MGLRFRKSVKIAPGVRLNISKKSVGISAGVKGYRKSINSSGRGTTSIGVPGTGVSYVKTENLKSKKEKGSQQPCFFHCCRRQFLCFLSCCRSCSC